MALTKEDLQAISALMDSKLEPINARLDTMQADITGMKEDIEQIKEDTAITRETTNSLGEWADVAADVLKVKYPIKE